MNLDDDKFFVNLKRFSITDIIAFSMYYSQNSASTNYNFEFDSNSNIFPWEIDSLLLIKLFVGQSSGNVRKLTQYNFCELINFIKTKDHSREFLLQNRNIIDFLPIINLNYKFHFPPNMCYLNQNNQIITRILLTYQSSLLKTLYFVL